MNKKTAILFLVIILLAGLLLFLWFQKNSSKEQVDQPITPTQEPTIVSSPTPTPVPAPTTASSPTPTPDQFSNWTTYTNNDQKYRFKYDPDWKLSTQASAVTIQGDISNKGWPSIGISKLTIVANNLTELKTEVENLFGGPLTETSIGSGIQTVLLERAASPQAYAGKDYYFLHQGNTLLISLNDTGHAQGDQLYQHFLDNFELY